MTIAGLLQPFSTGQISACILVVFLTAIMRGYTGFGFALVAVPLLALIADPVTAVPMVLLLEVIGSLLLMEFPSRADAERFSAGDPYRKAGLFQSVAITPWRKVLP